MIQFLLVHLCRAARHTASSQQAMRALGQAGTCLRQYPGAAASPAARPQRPWPGQSEPWFSNSRRHIASATGEWLQRDGARLRAALRPPACCRSAATTAPAAACVQGAWMGPQLLLLLAPSQRKQMSARPSGRPASSCASRTPQRQYKHCWRIGTARLPNWQACQTTRLAAWGCRFG